MSREFISGVLVGYGLAVLTAFIGLFAWVLKIGIYAIAAIIGWIMIFAYIAAAFGRKAVVYNPFWLVTSAILLWMYAIFTKQEEKGFWYQVSEFALYRSCKFVPTCVRA